MGNTLARQLHDQAHDLELFIDDPDNGVPFNDDNLFRRSCMLMRKAAERLDKIAVENARFKNGLEMLAAQTSGVIGSTAKADCMAAYANATLRDPD